MLAMFIFDDLEESLKTCSYWNARIEIRIRHTPALRLMCYAVEIHLNTRQTISISVRFVYRERSYLQHPGNLYLEIPHHSKFSVLIRWNGLRKRNMDMNFPWKSYLIFPHTQVKKYSLFPKNPLLWLRSSLTLSLYMIHPSWLVTMVSDTRQEHAYNSQWVRRTYSTSLDFRRHWAVFMGRRTFCVVLMGSPCFTLWRRNSIKNSRTDMFSMLAPVDNE